jgi:hypothetical protein
MEDEHSDLKKRLWILLGVLAGIFIAGRILSWHAFPGQGFNPFRWDDWLVGALGAIAARICFALLGQRKVTTTLGLGEATARKLR